jgi:CAAX protease family protein
MRLRDTIKQLLVAVLYVGIPFVLSNIALKWLPDGAGMAPLRNGFKIVVLIAAYLGYVRWVERRAPFELSLHGAPKEAGVGFLLGASVIGVSVAVLAGLGVYRVDGINLEVTWIRYLVTFLAVAILEEMIFRVLLFRLIEKSLGSVLAIILSTAVFGLAHLINPNASWIAAVSLTLSSVILVAGFVLTRRLWLCMGFALESHAGTVLAAGVGQRDYGTAEGSHERVGVVERRRLRHRSVGGHAGLQCDDSRHAVLFRWPARTIHCAPQCGA